MKRIFSMLLLLSFALTGASAQGMDVLEARNARLQRAPFLGPLDDQSTLDVDLALGWRDPDGLDALIRDLYDPQSLHYRQFLSPDQFAERFGPSPADFQSLLNFAQAKGLSVVGRSPSRLYIQVRAKAGALGRALGVSFLRRLRPDGTEFYAAQQFPRLRLAGLDVQATGLDNYSRPEFRHRPSSRPRGQGGAQARAQASGARGGTSSGPAWPGQYMGYDFRDAYAGDVPASLSGAGQVIGLLEPEGFYMADILAYEAKSNPPLVCGPPVLRKVDGASGSPSSDEGNVAEVSLDIELAQAMAPGALVRVYECPSGGNFTTHSNHILSAMATDLPLCRKISSSWGNYGDSTTVALFAQLAAQGQAFFQASGDFGAFADSNNNPPSSDIPDSLSSMITEVGGTELFTDGPVAGVISYNHESTWNDYACDPSFCDLAHIQSAGSAGGASGGGIFNSGINAMPIPTYQVGVSMAANGGSTTHRNVPDVAMLGESFVVVDNNRQASSQWDLYDGTSGSSPLMAGLVALVNQQAVAMGKQPLGFANPAFYALGKGGSYASLFNDINDGSGDNLSGLYPVSYTAVSGYDLCTGWGSPKGLAMVNALAGPLPTGSPTSTPTPSPTITPTFTASPTSTVTPTATPIAVDRLFVYPNPARDLATAEFRCSRPQSLQVRFFNLAGEAVDQVDFGAAVVGKNLIPLRLSKLAPGIYWVQLMSDQGEGYKPTQHFKLAIVRP